jgi:disulfide bond formation protein DsbB
MRSFEVILVLVVIAAAIAQMTKLAARWSLSLTLLGVLIGAWHIREVAHWQMFPALAGLVLLIIWQRNQEFPHTIDCNPLRNKLGVSSVGAHVFSSKANRPLSSRDPNTLPKGHKSY